MNKGIANKVAPNIIRSLVFGSEDSLISTSGVIFGIASTSLYTSQQIFLTGMVLISVEAVSMGVGSFITANSVHDYKGVEDGNPYIGGLVMFISYFLMGMIIVTPYLMIEESMAKYISILMGSIIIFFLGFIPKKSIFTGIRMVLLTLATITIGFLVGKVLS